MCGRKGPSHPCVTPTEGQAPSPITVFLWAHRSILHWHLMDRDPYESQRFSLIGRLVDRYPSYMGALFTRTYPCHHNIHKEVGFTTYHPPWNHWGDTSHNQRVQPRQAKRLMAPRHSTDQRCPALEWPKGATLLIYCAGCLPAHPPMCRLEPVTPQIVHKKGSNLTKFIPEQESGHVLVLP